MEQLTINDVYKLLGLPDIYDQYVETGELPHWKCSSKPEKLDFEFEKPEFVDGKLIIRVQFTIE